MATFPLLLWSALAVTATPRGELLDFTATWCGPCQRMSPIVAKLQRQGYPIRKVDVDQHRDLAQRYGISSIPAFVLVIDGRVAGRVTGATSEDALKQLMARIPREAPAPAAA